MAVESVSGSLSEIDRLLLPLAASLYHVVWYWIIQWRGCSTGFIFFYVCVLPLFKLCGNDESHIIYLKRKKEQTRGARTALHSWERVKGVGRGSVTIEFDWESDDVCRRPPRVHVGHGRRRRHCCCYCSCRLSPFFCACVHAPVTANISFYFSSPLFF